MLRLILILILITGINANAIIIDEKLEDQKQENLAITIFKEIKCLTCPGQSIQDSDSGFAQDLRKFIRDELKEGKSKEEVEKHLTSKFGEAILLTPPKNHYTYILWIFPLLFIMFSIMLVRRKFKN